MKNVTVQAKSIVVIVLCLVSLVVGQASATVVKGDCVRYRPAEANLPVALVSDGTIESDFEIEDDGRILDVDVYLDIECNSTSALKVELQAPSGAKIILFDELDNDGENFESTHLDDEAGDSIYSGVAPYSDVYYPQQALSSFDGLSIQGTWQLYISDLGGGSTGQLNSWNVCIVSEPIFDDCVGYDATDPQLPLAVVENDTVMSSFEIEDEGLILDVNVVLDVTCSSTSALEVDLQAPSGDKIRLFSQVDNNGQDFNNTALDDEGAYDVHLGFPPFRNTYIPGDDLSTFDGQSITGTWQLYMTDVEGSTGTLNNWSLCLETEPEPEEGEAPAEGEGEVVAEGEGEAAVEGEGEVVAEGEGEAPEEGEGEVVAEGEGEIVAEGEGEAPVEGEGEEEGEDEACGCCSAPEKDAAIKALLKRTLGDWLLVGMSLTVLLSLSGTCKS
ncbi:MAG: hypothetical protein GXY07_16770 [Candidatus Hydrogenedentes bacterium]|nr:hypothetical protein [Candidatus Hydrogenedentota bacterium]